MDRHTGFSYAAAERSWRHVFVRDLKLVSPVANRRLRINLDMAVLEETGPTGDHLANVVCYEAMTTNIRKLVAIDRISSSEALAERIASMSLHDTRVQRVRVLVEMPGASVEIERGHD